MSHFERPTSRDDFEIAIICALPLEADAVEASFDDFLEDDGHEYGKAPGDPNAYTLGRIGRHNVVLAWNPGMGKTPAASVAASLRTSFLHIRLGLVVGICAAAPEPDHWVSKIFLGDVIVSTSIVQYDFGRQLADKSVRKVTVEDSLGRASHEIRSFYSKLQGKRQGNMLKTTMSKHITALCSTNDYASWSRPSSDKDRLFAAEYRHKHRDPASNCAICPSCVSADDPTCLTSVSMSCALVKCDDNQLIPWYTRREVDEETDPKEHARQTASELHFGRIASGDQVIKSSLHRDRIAEEEKVIGFEMEGAGVWDNLPTIVIKGVCDYGDSHKDKRWQAFAALAAAACARAILYQWRSTDKKNVAGSVPAVPSNPVESATRSNAAPAQSNKDTFTFNNHGNVGTQIAEQRNEGTVINGSVHSYHNSGDNYGNQVGFNLGTNQTNNRRSR